jgi:hypothetical protein
LSDIELNFRYFSERALISLKVLPDFDSTIRRFESSRPSPGIPRFRDFPSSDEKGPPNAGFFHRQ